MGAQALAATRPPEGASYTNFGKCIEFMRSVLNLGGSVARGRRAPVKTLLLNTLRRFQYTTPKKITHWSSSAGASHAVSRTKQGMRKSCTYRARAVSCAGTRHRMLPVSEHIQPLCSGYQPISAAHTHDTARAHCLLGSGCKFRLIFVMIIEISLPQFKTVSSWP